MPDDIAPAGAPFPEPGRLEDIRLQIDAIVESQRQMNLSFVTSDQLGRQFARSLTTAFTGLAIQGKSFRDVLGSLALSLSNLTLGAAFRPLGSAFSSALQSLISGPALFSGSGIASPADFTMGTGSSAVPLGGFGSPASAGPSITFNVSTPDAESFARSETQIAAMLARTVAQGQRNL